MGNSKNRVKGKMITKSVNVTKEVYRDVLINKLIPAIVAKWPRTSAGVAVYIQQDNAKPHIDPNDETWLAAKVVNGINIQLKCQPPNSPHMNVLDLGYFRTIPSLQYKRAARDIDELIAAVHESFAGLSRKKLTKKFFDCNSVLLKQ